MSQKCGQITDTLVHRQKLSSKRIWRRRGIFSLLVVASASIGAFVGLALVYRFDLPQINYLVHYRPISNTVLYYVQGRAFVTFAIQRRIIARYDVFPY